MNRKQLSVLFVLLGVYALCAFLTYAFFADQLAASAGLPMPDMGVSNLVFGFASAGIVLVIYGCLGLAGNWFAWKMGLPGIFAEDLNWRSWGLTPLLLGAGCGLVVIIGDLVFAPINDYGHFPHPGFPVSLLASLSAGIGEEILFRGFVYGLYGVFFNWILRRFNGQAVALWIANILAALAFGAGHLGSVIALTGVSSPAELNPIFLVEIFLLNGIVGLVAGDQYKKVGLIAAVGVHFWADIIWHVIWGVFV